MVLEAAVNEVRYDPTWSKREGRPFDLIRDLNATVLHSWHSWNTTQVLSNLQKTLYQNYWSVLTSRGRNEYDRRAAPGSPTIQQLSEHLEYGKSDTLWTEALEMFPAQK